VGAASNREIAEALFVSVETVKTHMRALFDAFEVGDVPQYHKRTELVRRALETGLVTAHDLQK
jgi:DNA-binding NarL/FixJ family response regulator